MLDHAALVTATAVLALGVSPPTAADLTPIPSTREVVATAPDPHGKLPWGLELSRSETGRTCRAANAVHDGRLVIMGASGRPFPRTPAPQLNCVEFSEDAGPREHANVSAVGQYDDIVFHGLVDEHVRDVTIVTPEGDERRVQVNEHGAFIVAFAGGPTDAPLYDVRVTLDDGTVVTYFD